MFVLTYGCTIDNISHKEGEQKFSTIEEVLEFAKADFELNDEDLTTLKTKGCLYKKPEWDSWDWIHINKEIICPQCKEPIWDVAKGSKLHKCWGCGLAFDEPDEE